VRVEGLGLELLAGAEGAKLDVAGGGEEDVFGADGAGWGAGYRWMTLA
jgi:hypothetical protein